MRLPVNMLALALAVAAAGLAACRTAPPAPAGPVASERVAIPKAPEAPAALPPLDASALDRSVNPCQDFYAFACGGWLARTEIPADKPRWGRGFSEIHERNEKALRAILDADAAGEGDAQDRYVRKVGDYVAACMDEPAVEAHGLDDLRAEWARLDGVVDPETLGREVARLHRNGVSALFGFQSTQDARDATQVIGELEQGGLGLPDREYYLAQDEKRAAIRAGYLRYMARMLGLAGVPEAEAGAQAQAIFDLERSLAESHWTRTELRDPVRRYNRVDRGGLAKLAPRFPWASYLEGLGHPDIRAITVTTPRFVERVNRLVTEVPADTWRAYLRWRLLAVTAKARALPRAFVEENFAFGSKYFTGAKELEPRWKRCVAATDQALGEALGQSYVRLHFGAEGKERTSRLVAEVENAMERDLGGLAWMDAPTRGRALEKLGRIVNKIGYPDKWRNYDRLEVTRSSFFRSLLAADAFEVNRDLTKIGKPLDRSEWLMTPPSVNAYYEPALNEMVFPAGILQPPFFNRNAPSAVNYGSVGMIVGHELTHGFDDEGRQYDALGNLRDWWTPAVSAEFDRRAQCVVKQFEGYEAVDGLHLNGKLTLGENIADLGGIKLAFAAHRAASAVASLPALAGFTPDQQFFVGIAQAWCEKIREPFARMLVTVDPHSPAKYRVNGPLSNLPEFATAFACPAGAPMARIAAERCEVW